MLSNFRTYQLAKEFYSICQNLRFKSPLKDQFERAALSIVLNLAEGSAKPTQADRKRFYSIAMGSLRETQAILDLCGRVEELKLLDCVAASLFRLIQNPGGR